MSSHTCFDEMNVRLKPHNAQIAHGFAVVTEQGGATTIQLTHYVQTEKLDTNVRSKKPPLVVMTHCPFCGIDLSESAQS